MLTETAILNFLFLRSVELFAHRFASHVCQTLLTLAADVVEQEVINGLQGNPNSENSDEEMGQLLSMEQLVLGMCEVCQVSFPFFMGC